MKLDDLKVTSGDRNWRKMRNNGKRKEEKRERQNKNKRASKKFKAAHCHRQLVGRKDLT